jgi:hypothetical protein
MLMSTLSGATRILLVLLGAVIVWYANGDDAGVKRKTWKTCLGLALPGVFPPEVRAQATALACSLPKEEGQPVSRWSLETIAARLVAPAINHQHSRQYPESLVCGRETQALALPFLATYPESRDLSGTRSPGLAIVRAGSRVVNQRHLGCLR